MKLIKNINFISKSFLVLLCSILLLNLVACSKAPKDQIQVGVIAGPAVQLMQAVKNIAKSKYGLKIKVIPFTDYTIPNTALANGDIKVNVFQTIPYFQATLKNRGYKLSIVGKTFIYPMAVYSKKVKSLKDLKEGAKVAIPSDPSNEARSLILLQKAGLIKLRNENILTATPSDISSNPKKLKFVALQAAQLPRSLNDVSIAIINSNYAIAAGLNPAKDSIYEEGKDSLYANIIVVRTQDKSKKWVKEFVAAFQTPKVVAAAKKLYNGQAIPAWSNDKKS